MGLKKKNNMGKIFGIFLLKIIIGILLSVAIPWLGLELLIYTGYIIPANYNEQIAKSVGESLRDAEDVDVILKRLPRHFNYLIYSEDNSVIKTDLKNKELDNAIYFIKEGNKATSASVKISYITVLRSDNDILLQYKIEAFYSNKILDRILPTPTVLVFILMVINILIISVIQIKKLQKRFQIELKTITEITNEVAVQNLDALIPTSKVSEFNDVLTAFSHMQAALKDSLKKQQEIQKTQKEQIAALAHDIRTPMTVTLGSLDLLQETELDEEQNQYVQEAQNGIEDMKKYVSLLTELTVAETHYSYNKKKININELCEEIQKKATILCQNKGIDFNMDIPSESVLYSGDELMLERAFMNVIRNAVEYTPEKGKIDFTLLKNEDEIIIDISDSGKGFSEEMLSQGTKLFSMDDKSRNANGHYGVGLYFTKSVIDNHGGKLELRRSEKLGGAEIKIIFSV